MRTAPIAAPAFAALAVTVAVSLASADATTVSVSLGKIQYDSPGDDTGTNTSLNGEWVRVTNPGHTTKTLTGWTLRDPDKHVYTFPEFKLKPGKTVTIHTGDGTDTKTDLFWDAGSYVWNNGGDTAILKDVNGKPVDSCKWGDGSGVTTC